MTHLRLTRVLRCLVLGIAVSCASTLFIQCSGDSRTFVRITPSQPENYTVLLDTSNCSYNYDIGVYEQKAEAKGQLQIVYLDTFVVFDSVVELGEDDTLSLNIAKFIDDINRRIELGDLILALPDNTEMFFHVDFSECRSTDFFKNRLQGKLDSIVSANSQKLRKEFIFEADVNPVWDPNSVKVGLSGLRWDNLERLFDFCSPVFEVECTFKPHLLQSSLVKRTEMRNRSVNHYRGYSVYYPEWQTYLAVTGEDRFIAAKELVDLYEAIDRTQALDHQVDTSGKQSLLYALAPEGQGWVYLPITETARTEVRAAHERAEQQRQSDREVIRVLSSVIGDLEAALIEVKMGESVGARIRLLFDDPEKASRYSKAIYGLSFFLSKMVPPENSEIIRALELVEVENEGRIAVVELDLPEPFAAELVGKLFAAMR